MSKDTLVNQKKDAQPQDDIPFSQTEGDAMEAASKSREDRNVNPVIAMGSSEAGKFRREIYLAIIQGFAARGELSRRIPGNQLGVTTDADVQSICRHAAGVAMYAHEAAKTARL